MRYGPEHFDSRTPGWLAAALRSGEAGRHPLARGLCGRGNRRDARGGPGPAAARPVPDPGWPAAPVNPARSRPAPWGMTVTAGCGRRRWRGTIRPGRAANIGRVVRDHRFPILPGVRGPRAGPACPAYGGGQGGERPAGPILRAAGRGPHPRRKGRRRQRPARRGPGPGGIHLREARRGRHGDGPGAGDGWREALHHMDRRPAGTPAGLHHGAGDMGRTGREYGRSGHTDGRVRRRIAGMGRAWMDGHGGGSAGDLSHRGAPSARIRTRGGRRRGRKRSGGAPGG